ncbi:MAG: NTP pyrophosphatase (non-canonical NTP hydrolase) [Saprospiraceae bacterium]|jgi:NTP pyrophosphatase (non-canonical NTP hydrolase)
MQADEYQRLAGRTSIEQPGFKLGDTETMISWNALGLTGEAGEVADLIKKGIYHQQGLDHEKLKKELGDVLWYVAALSRDLGFSMSEIMEGNIAKLEARFPEGYDPERTTFRGEGAV